jgi:hypothetical protein
MAGMIMNKVRSFLSSPHTYPKSGLPFGENAGGIAAGRPSRSATTNIMPVGNVGANMTPKLLNTNEQLSANFTVKSANINEQSSNMTNKIDGGTIAKIRQLALEKCAGDEQLAERFMEGFFDEVMSKQAAAPDINLVGELGKGFMGNIGKGMAGLAMGMGAMGIGKAFTGAMNDRLHGQFVNALKTAIQTNPILRQAKKEKVVNYAETIFKFAPHVATDANLLSSVLANAVHGEGIDPMTLKSLSELESRYKDNTNDNQAFSPKSYV